MSTADAKAATHGLTVGQWFGKRITLPGPSSIRTAFLHLQQSDAGTRLCGGRILPHGGDDDKAQSDVAGPTPARQVLVAAVPGSFHLSGNDAQGRAITRRSVAVWINGSLRYPCISPMSRQG